MSVQGASTLDYLSIEEEDVVLPSRTKADFLNAVESAINNFENNALIKKLSSHTVTISDYHSLLLTLFHQTYYGPSTFALAGVMAESSLHRVRDYLLKHASEERSHWTWVISDLRSTGYDGKDPRELFPTLSCQSYIAYQNFLSLRFPMGRLGMGIVLEGIGGTLGGKYGKLLMTSLKLKPNQAQFFLQHGELDVGHTKEILSVIERENISGYEWAHLCYVAETTGKLYKAMYDSASL